MIKINFKVDASGLNCPLPLLRLKKALIDLQSREVVRIIATDPAAHLDFGVFAEQSGHTIIEFEQKAGKQIFYIQKK
jgi:tRNA 2-thiouridine synthesizing protein A